MPPARPVHPSRLYELEDVELPEHRERSRWPLRVLGGLLAAAVAALGVAVAVGGRGSDETPLTQVPADVGTALRNDPLARYVLPTEVGGDRSAFRACGSDGTHQLVGWRGSVTPGYRAGAVLLVGQAADGDGWTLVGHDRVDPAGGPPPVSIPGDQPGQPGPWAGAEHLTYVKARPGAPGWKADVLVSDAHAAVVLAVPEACG